jgi:hypothetical protein
MNVITPKKEHADETQAAPANPLRVITAMLAIFAAAAAVIVAFA